MLTIFTLEESEKWDATVRTFNSYDVYWLSGYVKAFEINGDGKPLLFYYEDEHVRGINVVMKRDVANDPHFESKLSKNTYFDFATTYGYGGWIIEGTNSDNLFKTYFDWCKKNGIICEFVRFHPVIGNSVWSKDKYEVIDLGNTIALDLTSPEIIWENITSKNRNMIRKAQKSGVEIYSGRNKELYESFKTIYNATMKHDDADDYYYFKSDFYESICYDLPENAQLFYAMYDGEMIAASIMIAANGKLNYHLSGSKIECRNLAPSNLLLYKAALWGFENGYKTFHLGGGVGSSEDSLFKFKKSFYRKDDLCQFSIGKQIFIEDKYNELVSMRSDINNDSYFPKYRA